MKRFKLTEDWTATVVGWLIILLIVCQFKPTWPSFAWPDAEILLNKVIALDNVGHSLIVFGFMFCLALIAGLFSGKRWTAVVYSFPVVFLLTLIAMVVGGNKFLKTWGFETVIFSLLLGLFISNIFTLPKWLKDSLSSELFVKIGLVLLGTNVLFGDLLEAGALGLIQSCVVVFVVWNFCFWLCRKMKIDKEMALMLSSAVSICGVSAAVATAGAIKGDKKKLSYVVSLVMVVAVPMIIILPVLAKLMGVVGTDGRSLDRRYDRYDRSCCGYGGNLWGRSFADEHDCKVFTECIAGSGCFCHQYLLVVYEKRRC